MRSTKSKPKALAGQRLANSQRATAPRIRRRKMSLRGLSSFAGLQNRNVLDCKTAICYTGKRMDEREYQKHKAEFAAKREARIDAANADYEKEMEALEIIRAASKEIEKNRELSDLTKSRMVITDLVMAVLPTLGDEFTSFDIERAIWKKFPEAKGAYKHNSLSGTISRMVGRKQLEVITQGSGPKGSTYRRAE